MATRATDLDTQAGPLPNSAVSPPPENVIRAGDSAIGAMVKDNSRIAIVRGIMPVPTDFPIARQQDAARRIYLMTDIGIPVDHVSLSNELFKSGEIQNVGGYAGVENFVHACPSPMNAAYHAGVISEYAASRALLHSLDDCRRAIVDGVSPVDEMLKGHRERLDVIQNRRAQTDEFPVPVIASNLPRTKGIQWVMNNFIALGMVTLFVALWKSGKTTWESILFRLMGCTEPSDFCGQAVRPGKIIVLSEEPALFWELRRDYQLIRDNVSFITRDMLPSITSESWKRLCRHCASIADQNTTVVIDTLSQFWPVKDENDNAQVSQAFLALREITKAGAAVLVMHHPAKSDAGVGKLSRGASSLAGAADICIEMRRENEQDLTDRRRKIDWYGRSGTGQVIIELTDDGRDYIVLGSPQQAKARDRMEIIAGILPTSAPGFTTTEVLARWPEKRKPKIQDLREALLNQSDAQELQPQRWHRAGKGARGSPYLYWIIKPSTGQSVEKREERPQSLLSSSDQ